MAADQKQADQKQFLFSSLINDENSLEGLQLSRSVFPTASFVSFNTDEVYRSFDVNACTEHEPSTQQQLLDLGGTDIMRSVDTSLADDSHSHHYESSETPSFDIDSFPLTAGSDLGFSKPSLSQLAQPSLNPKQARPLESLPFAAEADLQGRGKQLVLSSSAAAQLAIVEPPPVPGGYLEPSYHVHSATSPQQLLQTVWAALQHAQVDCTMKPEKFKLKCNAYRNGARLPFSVRIFSFSATEADKKYAVEFQRRSGDVMHFNEIFRSVKRVLISKKMVEPAKIVAVEVPPALPMELAAPSVEQTKDTLKCLAQMASSKCVDVKAQAMLALAEFSASGADMKAMMVASSALDVVIEELSCKFEDVHRCAITAVANLAYEREDVCKKVHAAGGIKTLLGHAQSETLQVVRECARALANIGSTMGKKVLDQEFIETLRALRCCRDPRARENVVELMEKLRL